MLYGTYWQKLILLLFVFILQSLPESTALADGQALLSKVEQKVERKFPNVSQMRPEDLENLRLDQPRGIVILDVREPNEFAVSHLPGAIRVDPGIKNREFLRKFAQDLKGKTLVLYCSVGYRSSRLAARIQKPLTELGAKGVHNLRGGIFAWHNKERSIVKGKTETKEIHAYNKAWSRYLNFNNFARFDKETWW